MLEIYLAEIQQVSAYMKDVYSSEDETASPIIFENYQKYCREIGDIPLVDSERIFTLIINFLETREQLSEEL